MSENEKIKIVKLGDITDSMCNDIIQVDVSPQWLEEIARVFEEKTLNTKDYDLQGLFREKADFFNEALDVWRKARKELDGK